MYQSGDIFRLKISFTRANLNKVLNIDTASNDYKWDTKWRIPTNVALKKGSTIIYISENYTGERTLYNFEYQRAMISYGRKYSRPRRFPLTKDEVNTLLAFIAHQDKQLELDFGGE